MADHHRHSPPLSTRQGLGEQSRWASTNSGKNYLLRTLRTPAGAREVLSALAAGGRGEFLGISLSGLGGEEVSSGDH
jgi:hypothetical protein